MRVLIIGGDGQIGSALQLHMIEQGHSVIATTRHGEKAGPDRPLLDLEALAPDWQPPAGVGTAIFCAARTSQQECRDHPEASYVVNVETPARIGAALAQAGIFTLFLSTTLVFDGAEPAMKTDRPYAPIGAYGAQKAEAEQRLAALFAAEKLAIVRLSKVLAPSAPLLRGWRTDLAAGRTIAPFDDVHIAPISLSYTAAALTRIAEAGRGGIFHLSARDELSYAALARALARAWGQDERLVVPKQGRAPGGAMQEAPLHASLESEEPSSAATIQDLVA